MSSSEKKYQFYIKETGQWVPVSEEFFKAYYRDIDAHRHKQQYDGHCACSGKKRWLCNKLCEDCKFSTVVAPLSLEAEMETDEGTITLAERLPSPATNVEELAIQKVTLDALYRELEHLASDDRRIFELYLAGNSEREIARIMNLPWTTYKRRRQKAMEILREKFKN